MCVSQHLHYSKSEDFKCKQQILKYDKKPMTFYLALLPVKLLPLIKPLILLILLPDKA